MTTPVQIDDLSALRGKFLRHTRNNSLWEILDTGKHGCTVQPVDGQGQKTGAECVVTWRAVKALYSIILSFEELTPLGDPDG